MSKYSIKNQILWGMGIIDALSSVMNLHIRKDPQQKQQKNIVLHLNTLWFFSFFSQYLPAAISVSTALNVIKKKKTKVKILIQTI